MHRQFSYKIEQKYDGRPIRSILKYHFRMSTGLIARLKRTPDGIMLNGEKRFVNFDVKTGDELVLNIREDISSDIAPFPLPDESPMKIIFEDEDMIVIDKPANTTTYPCTVDDTASVANGLAYYFSSKGIECVFHAVNRLDRDTTGLMLVAKHGYAHALLCDSLHSRDLQRKYKCIMEGTVTEPFVVDAPIGRAETSILEHMIREDGKPAKSAFTPLENFTGPDGKPYTLSEVTLYTGRTHQIRLHAAHIGHPLLGDWLYGVENKELFPRPALHSYHLSLTHPFSGETFVFESGLPPDMIDFMREKL